MEASASNFSDSPSIPSCREVDIVVYGGTSAGLIAGIQAKRMGKTVLVIEPSAHLGGLTTGGLGQTDIGLKAVVGGLSREFYRRIRRYYEQSTHWPWQDRSKYRDGGQTQTLASEDAMWTFEPMAAGFVFREMVAEAGLEVITRERLERKGGVIREENKIIAIRMESGLRIHGKVFLDATYEGDLMAAAGVRFVVGREANETYGETLNGVQTDRWAPTLTGLAAYAGDALIESSRDALSFLSMNAANHGLADGIDPYRIPGDTASGLLPGIEGGHPGIEGSADHRVQAYCFRATLTDHPDNRLPFPKPVGYDELQYELLFRHFEQDPDAFFWINSTMPNRKTDTNNGGGFSSDFIGANFDYPEADYATREGIVEAHRRYQMGFYWTLANHPRIPEKVRRTVSAWGLPKDEFVDHEHWSPQLYIREARRLMGRLVMTQRHAEGLEEAPRSVGMAAYGMDSHHVRRYVDVNGWARNEGNVQAHVRSPYPIGSDALLPLTQEAENLIVPVCLAASHIAYGSIRMEPVFMVLGQSAATMAALAIEETTLPARVDYDKLAQRLRDDGQILELKDIAEGNWN